MKEKNQNTKVKNKNGKHINMKVAIIPIIATAIIAAIVGVYLSNKDNNKLSVISPEIARSMTYDQVQEGEENVEGTNEHVKFDAFFLRDLNGDGYAESIRGTCNEIGKEATLYMELNVLTEGYLENGKIAINGENIYLQTNLPKDDELADNYIGNNIKEINLKQINNGTQKLITGIVRSGDYTYDSCKANAIGSNINNYSKVNSVTLTGTYVYTDEGGTEQRVDINKTVEFNVDWYGTTKANIYNTNQSKYLDDLINQTEGKIDLNFTINTEEMNNQLLLKSNHTEVEIPNLNGYAPLEVVYTGSNATVNYNEKTRILTLDRTSSISEDGILTNKLSTTNSYGIRVTYPVEAYTSLGLNAVQISLPVRTYYEGYNNTNNEFTNPYKSNTAKTTIVATYKKYGGTVAALDITVGNRVSSPEERYVVSKQKPLKLYNGQSENEDSDTYIVKWEGHIGTNTNLNKVVMKETQNGYGQVTDQFIKTDGSQESMEEVTSNIGICFSGMDDLLGEDGYINVYDEETGNLLATFTKDNWNRYTSSNPYRYEIPVKHIRIETSAIVNNDVYFYIYNIKELNDDKITTKYDRNQFDKLEYIKSQVVMYVGETFIGTDTFSAYYEAPYSIATMSISKNTLSTQVTEKNNIITINANANLNANQVKWINGTFLIKLPDEMLSVEINDVEVDNPNVEIGNYEVIQLNGQKFIKIVTQNDIEQTFSITIDVDLTPDPRIETMTRSIELYASNESACDYYYKAQDIYDVNNNLNTNEQVNYRAINISMVAPNSLLTNQTATEFDDKGSVVVSPQIADIKPIYAVVDQEKEVRTAKIGVQIKNNYTSTISEIQILGKIPFEGNTYVISGEDLESTFTTKMTNAGIEIPAELQSFAKVYYSNNENPDKDINKAENGWKTTEEITNWDGIKTFLIDLGNYVMPTGKDYVFYYTVKIPNGLEFNKISYSHHGVYFSLDTDEGKYRTQTEPNKLGFRIAEKYDLVLNKFQKEKDKLVQGATYSVQEIITEDDGTETTGDSKTGLTDTNGMLTITNLYAEKLYELKEIKTPNDYELNSNVIRFIGHVDDEGILTIEKKEGETKQDLEVKKEESENYKVIVQVEDEVKASIKIIKKEQGTDIGIDGVKYKLKGYNLPENGKTIRTNTNGEAEINGISINQEYTLEEVKAEGYYLTNPIKFKIVNNEGNYSLEIIQEEGIQSGTIASQNTTEEDSIPTINIILEDEKIPTYNLQILKIKKTTESTVSQDELIAKAETDLAGTEVIPLANATFKLMKGEEDLGKYTTGEDGTLTIEGLYQYESEKDIDQTYLLKEVMAPEGYAKVKDISFRVQKDNGSLILIDESGEEQNYSVEGETVKLIIEDSPSFKLVKKDAETKEPLANVKFALFNVDDGTEQLARNGKGEIIGTKEIINGREYYTVETDNNGELTADLPEGLYKAVEVQAPDKYDISESEYYFGIGASREAPEGFRITQVTTFGGDYYNKVTSIVSNSEGGYVVVGDFESNVITVGDYTLTNKGLEDGMIIKYDAQGEVEWASSIGGDDADHVTSVATTTDGGYVVAGYFESQRIVLGEHTIERNGNWAGYNIMIIKYSNSGEVEWATATVSDGGYNQIHSIAGTSDGGCVAVGNISSPSLTIGGFTIINNDAFEDNGIIVKFDKQGTVIWVKSIGGSRTDEINSVAATNDGGFIVGGYFERETITVGNYTLTNSGVYDGMLIKYDLSGNVEWAKSIGGDEIEEINSVVVTEDGDYIIGGYFESNKIIVGDYILQNEGYYDGMIIKYDEEGNVKWATTISGDRTEEINALAATSDGGCAVGMQSYSSSISIGDYTISNPGRNTNKLLKFNDEGKIEEVETIETSAIAGTNNGGYIVGGGFGSNPYRIGDYFLTPVGLSNKFLVKFEKVELAKPIVTDAQNIGMENSESIYSVTKTNDGGYIVGGYFSSNELTLGDYILKNAGDKDGIIIKYDEEGSIEYATNIGGNDNDEITSVLATNDGGAIVVGNFESTNITIGDYTLANSGNSDGIIIKYDLNGNVEWARSVKGSNNEYIESVAQTSDGDYIVGGSFSSNEIIIDDYILKNAGSEDGMIIKYSNEGNVVWVTRVGGKGNEAIMSVSTANNGDYIVGGYFESDEIDLGEYTLKNAGKSDGMIIKYDSYGNVEYADSIGGDNNDSLSSVIMTDDGGYLIGGDFDSDCIIVDNYPLYNYNYNDAMVIKYDKEGKVEWANSIKGNGHDYIECIAESNDGGYIVGGGTESSCYIGNYKITNIGNEDGILIKYTSKGSTEWVKLVGGTNNDRIYSVLENNNGEFIAVGGFYSNSIESDDEIITNNYEKSNGMILKIVNKGGVPEVEELLVENNRKEYKITTNVEEIDGKKGGSISGENRNPYESVKYGDNSTKEIVMTPDEGYEIIGITVNGEEYQFTENIDGTYTMPQFTDVTEDKHIVVTYSKKDNKIVINKVEAETSKPIEGITFKLDQIEERAEPENVIGTLTDNGATYTEVIPDTSNEITEQVTGKLTNNGTYYFVQNEDGTLTPTNSKTYQTAHEGTAGIQSTTANSYVQIDLSGLEGQYVVVVNANISSESVDYGYATITQSTSAPSYSSSTGRFMYISGTSSSVTTAKDYTTTTGLQGGQVYYLHLGYRKDSSVDTGDDQVVINSIKVYRAQEENSTYNFISNGQGGYESNNQGQASTTANSYIPIDLTGSTGKYNLTVNANVSSQSSDYAYATVTSSTTAPKYNDSTGRFIYISGTSEEDTTPTDYTTVLQGGSMYYLHLGYYKNASTDSGDDKFTVNSVEITLNDSELYHTEVTTNSEGQAITQIPFGKYQVTEVNTPEGYESIEPIIINFKDEDKSVVENNNNIQVTVNENGEFTIENKQLQRVIVHHYLKNDDGEYTTTPVAEDEILVGKAGEEYETKPHLDLDKYELEKDEEGNYVIPENANGTYDDLNTDQEVVYYYETKDYPLIVHHYIEGTTKPVVLKDGSLAEDETDSGKEGETYTTDALTPEELSDKYEIAEIPENWEGTYGTNEVIVTYYYKVKQIQVTTKVEGAGGTISGQDETPYEEVEYGEDSTKDIIATPEEGYRVSTITVNGEPIEFTPEEDKTVVLDKFIDMTEDKEVVVTFEQIPAQVIVHHYIEGTEDKVPAQNGGVVEDETRSGHVGDMYASQASINVSPNYEYVSSTDNTSGLMTEDPIEVIYYYQLKQAGIEQQIDKTASPDTITQEDEQVTYNITYTGTITDYIGNAKVTIVDTLPFSIDTTEGKSDLNGGSYDAGSNTITWEENISDIDTFTNPETGKITITKQIKVTYADMDYSKTSFNNKVQGNIYLEATEQEEPTNEDTVTTNTDFRTQITVTKVWNHTNNIYTRPTQVELQVKNGEDIVARQVINSSNKVGEDENTWSYTFTNLLKYDEEGLLIDYTVDEAEVNSGDLAYYDKEISGNTITNTYAGPIISAVKDSTTENGLDYVVEGETITYTITVTNDGERDKVVTVQDSVPDGTTFKAGSVKVNGSGADNYTETNLNSGIPVNVTTHGTATVSFEVTVNPLEGNNLTKVITNTATVDGKDTDPVTETVNKSKLVFTKTSEPAGSTEETISTVTAGDKITYTINLTNEGTAPTTTIVKDMAPEGTTFAGNLVVMVNGVEQLKDNTTKYTEEDLNSGITVNNIPAKVGEQAGTASVSFTVTVNDIADGTEINNQATVGDSEEPNTNEVTHKYVEPIISQEKTSEILDAEERPVVGRDYALEGDIIKYTITVKNNGGLSEDVKISDTIPTGTTFVDGSIEVVNAKEEKEYTQADLNTGIEVTVPEKVESTEGTASVSFKVKVNELARNKYDGTVQNTAKVDEKDTPSEDVEIKKPHVVAHKESTPANGENVKAGQEITYRIVLDNTEGTAPGTVTVKDEVPEGTTYKDSSMMLDGIPVDNNAQDLANGLNVTVPAGQTSTLSFTVTVNNLENNNTQIKNVATVGDVSTEEITHTYVKPDISGEKSSEILNAEGEPVEGRDYALEGDIIKYTITVKNDGGLSGDAIITDEIPEGTEFVDGSIEVVNAKEEKEYTETDLNSGITVTVPEYGTATVSFEVTVEELAENTYTDTIRNTAYVDGDPTEETTDTVNKPNVEAHKTADPADGNVVAGQQITYIITLDNSKGTAPDTVTVKDTIPEGTTFVEGSVKVGGSVTADTEETLASGIEVTLAAGETKTVEFKVTVNDQNNGTPIRNTATVDDEPTEQTEHTYVEPVISATKKSDTENKLDYVVEGEKITYTITIKNDGDLRKDVTVTDSIPEGTSFIEGSIKVNNSATQDTQTNLKNGISVPVEARSESTLSFEVTVNELTDGSLSKEIRNTATVDGIPTGETTDTVNKPNVEAHKTADPADGNVVAGQEITYIITLDNSTGTAPDTVTVKDTIPTGTTFVEGSIKVGNQTTADTAENLANGIEVRLAAGETKTVEFKVTVNEQENKAEIRNQATVDDVPTEETTHTFVKPIISAEKESTTENGLGYVVEGEKITYTITVKNDGGLAKDVEIKDTIPDGTSFVEGSIKISNNPDTANLGEANLESGITVNVAAYGEETLSFEVTVDELTEGLTKVIRNTAIVDGTTTDEVTDTVNKSDVKFTKTADPADGNVVEGQEITYIITLDNSLGTAPADVTVKDTVPAGTTFVTGSVKVGNQTTADTEETLASGILVHLDAGEKKTVEFKVTVNDQKDNTPIKNKATVNDVPTGETTHTFVKPIITATKESTTENGLDYVVEGEKITYTITVKNDGGLADDVQITDEIPEGTSFVDGSIHISNNENTSNLGESDLRDGITVNAPAYSEETLSFQVTVDELPANTFEKEIKNIAYVDGTPTGETTDTVNKPNVEAHKTSDPASGTKVTTDDEITYIITLDNSKGTAPDTVTVKDEIPEGTTFVEGSIKVGGSATGDTEETLASGIAVSLAAGETKTVEFKVTVNELEDKAEIRNVATVDGEETDPVIHEYVKPIISATKASETENKLDYVVEGEKITYTITVKNNGGLADDVVVIDNIPEGIILVPDSIKIDGRPITEEEGNLNSGITVNVQPYSSKEVTFEVTVDELEPDTFTKEIENTATVDGTPTNDTTNTVNKPNVEAHKTADPADGNVVAGQQITYIITLDNSKGTAPDTVTVKDTIPEDTTFVDGSVEVGGLETENTAANLASGISVDLAAGETKTVEFKVTVNDLDNGTQIKNTATVDDEPTEETEHTYVEPIISATKESETENKLDYVVEGEKITYTITIKNDGDLRKDVTVTDSIPEGTSFVEGSIKVNNSATQDTQTNLKNGISVPVEARDESTLSFEVTVNELTDGSLTREIRNTATVDGTPTGETTNTVNKPNVQAHKTADPADGNVVEGQEITYIITLDNSTGTAPDTVTVKDTIPTGTTFVQESIKVENEERPELTQDNLTNGIEVDLAAGETKTVEFKVTVNDQEDKAEIRNTATVDGKPTETTTHTFVKPIISAEKESTTENGLGYVVEGEKITYLITITNEGGLAKEVVVTDSIPEGTSFVEGSIKVNNSQTEDTSDTLESGITVNVPEYGETTLSFEVTVDELTGGDLTKVIRNTAIVDGTPTDEITDTVNKSDVKFTKTASPADGNVVEGQEITYIITLDNSKGTAPADVTVKDTVPAGTTFVTGSIKVGNQTTADTEETLASGIQVHLDAGEKKTVEFKVTVNDQKDNTPIKNKATVNDVPTGETTHTFVKPIITATKESTTENGLDYVVEGEKITYTITVKNDGGLADDVQITDEIPDGTSFIDGSIKISNNANTSNLGESDLRDGITVNVPAYSEETLSFQVTVDELEANTFEKTIRNTATVDRTPTGETTDTVNKPNVEAHKTSDPASGTKVTTDDEITYIITLDNSKGTAPDTVTVKDEIPEGTTFVEGSIKVGNQTTADTEETLASGIEVDLAAGETKTVEFKVTVNDQEDKAEIRNTATVDDEPTEETTHTFVKPIISAEKSSTTENSLDYVVEGEKITYTITVKNNGGLADNVQITDSIPEGTSFVEGSIKISNNPDTASLGEDDLASGITVNVPAYGEETLSFEVTVDELTEGLTKEIKNTATVDGTPTNETTDTVNKAHVRIGKTSEPASGETVTAGNEIRYVIVLENTEGKAPSTLVVKDSIPEGTSFVEGSIKVKDLEREYTLEDLTTNGIEVTVPAGQTRTVEFKVTVNDLDNGYIIRNKANITNPKTDESKETNEVTHEYVEAIINAEKEVTTENGLSYAVAGEELTYTIRISNSGDLGKTFNVQDTIPAGTEFVNGSVLLNEQETNITKEQLESGFEVELEGNKQLTISFKVKVLQGATEITNIATVDNEQTNETKVPVISYEKTAEVIRQTEEELSEGTVTTGDKIKYTIKVNNLGEEAIEGIKVKDVIPEGTTLSKISQDGKINDNDEITWTIETLGANASIEVSFEVTVNYDSLDNKAISNVATVDGEETNTVETPYEKPEIKEESSIVKTGTEVIRSSQDEISYKITYTANIKDFVGEGKVTLVDYLPYEIDVENQYLDGGFYDSKTKTITWEEDLGAIDTYTSNKEKEVNIEKEITVKYVYGEAGETLEGTIPNRVEGTLQLTQKDSEKPGEDKVVLEDKKETTFETEVELPTQVIVHHYIEGTTTKVPSKVEGEVVEDETIVGYAGDEYTTKPSENVQENYKVVQNSGNVSGTMTETTIEVIYYYRLQPGEITENTLTKEGTDRITNKDDKVSYTLTYTGTIANYVGNAKVEIIDYLPYAIDEAKSNLDGGIYDPQTKTIRWEENQERVNTYVDGPKDISITKNIEVVFTQMNVTEESFVNRAQGKIILEETNQEQGTPEVEKVTKVEFEKDIIVEKVWDDNNNIKGDRPESVTVQLTINGNTTYNGQETEKAILSEANNWLHTFADLPKYTEDGQELNYSVIEEETNVGDLEGYAEGKVEIFDQDTNAIVRITNKYELTDIFLDASIEKTGTEVITSSEQEVSYNISYKAVVDDYQGGAQVTIIDYMPCAINEEKSDLAGGTYDRLTNTITWKENIANINNSNVSIQKNITVVFENLDMSKDRITNKVTGTIDLYDAEKTNTVDATYDTRIEIPGKVIVKYVDKDTGKEITYVEQDEEKTYGYEISGNVGDSYRTEQKDIYGYTFVESTNNTSGNMIEGTIEVIYYYERTNAGGVIVHYQDEEGNKLADDVTITGKVQDPYRTEQKEIPNYDFVRVEGQTEGTLTEGVIEVTYIYTRIPARVIVQHLEKDDTPEDNTDNTVLTEEEIIEGFRGDTYNTARKEIENYKPADPEPENAEGTMTREDIYVTYYYERKPSGIVTVKYVDVDTNEEILHKVELPDGSEEYVSYREQMSGLCGLEYITEQKDIPYYNFVEELRPSNGRGVYTEEDIEVIYYYRKQTFNLSIDKQINRITVNGKEHSLKEDLNQIDVVASQVQETDIVVTYKIVVSNPGEIEGTAKVIESIPEFFRTADGTSTEWTENGKSLETQVTLRPGETKELLVVLRWIRNSNNFGLQINTVTLQNVENPANYEETDLSDNMAVAEVIFSVKTGGTDTAIIIGTALIVMVGALIITIYLKEKKKK